MANTKLSALTALAAPDKDDLTYVVNDPSGTPASHRTTVGAFVAGGLAAIPSYTDLAAPDASDQLAVVDDPSGAPDVRRATIGAVFIGGLPNLATATELVAPDKDDLLPVVDDPAGTPVARKATVGKVIEGGLAQVPSFTSLTAPDKDDALVVIDDPGGSPLVRRATAGKVVAGGALEVLTTDGDLFGRAAGAAARIAAPTANQVLGYSGGLWAGVSRFLGARSWEVPFEGGVGQRPATNFAGQDQVPTTLIPCDAFDADVDETRWLDFDVPAAHLGTGTLKLALLYCANTTTTTLDARIDVATGFRSPGAGEAMTNFNLDGTPDSDTLTFSATAYALMLKTITLTPATTPVAGDKGRVAVTRDANNGASLDDLGVDLLLIGYLVYEAA